MFNKKFIKLDKKIESKEDLFKYIARKLYQYNRIDNEDNFINALNEREKEISTGIGNHIAIPHTKDATILKPTVFYVRLSEMIEYKSLDQKPVKHVFLIGMPANYFNEHLKVLAKISKLLLVEDNINFLNESNNIEEIYKLVNKYLGDN